jgi:fumarate hydratase class II
MSGKPRTEKDALGAVTVPGDRLWGAQTQRCLNYFKIGSERLPFPLIRALAAHEALIGHPATSTGLLSPCSR